MAGVLTTASTLACGSAAPHVGAVSAEGADLLRVDGEKVLTRTTVANATIGGCNNTGSNNTPCSKIGSISGGTATRLTIEGVAVALASLAAITNGVPPSTVKVSAVGHDLLRAE
jgi:hypothetical protein